MNSFWIFLFFIGSLDFAFPCFAFPLESKNGASEFVAIGRPAALKIIGHGVGPTGQLALVPDGNEYLLSGQVELDLDSFDTGIEMRDKHMKEKYLETSKNKSATIKFLKTRFKKELLDKNGEVKLPGTLLLHGVEKPVEVMTAFSKDSSGQMNTTSSFQIQISDFGIEIPSFSGLKVADQIQIKIETKLPAAELVSKNENSEDNKNSSDSTTKK